MVAGGLWNRPCRTPCRRSNDRSYPWTASTDPHIPPLASMLLFESFRRLRGRSAAPPLAPAALPTPIVVFGIEIGILVIFCCISSSDADCRGQGGGSSILRSFAGFVLVASVHVLARAVASTSTFSCLIASSLSSPAETLPPSMLPSFPPRSRELF